MWQLGSLALLADPQANVQVNLCSAQLLKPSPQERLKATLILLSERKLH
jgi:hypothetical protein